MRAFDQSTYEALSSRYQVAWKELSQQVQLDEKLIKRVDQTFREECLPMVINDQHPIITYTEMVGGEHANYYSTLSEWPTDKFIQTQTVEQIKENFKFTKISQYKHPNYLYSLQFYNKNGYSPVFGANPVNNHVNIDENAKIRQVVVYFDNNYLRGITFMDENNSVICEVKNDNGLQDQS